MAPRWSIPRGKFTHEHKTSGCNYYAVAMSSSSLSSAGDMPRAIGQIESGGHSNSPVRYFVKKKGTTVFSRIVPAGTINFSVLRGLFEGGYYTRAGTIFSATHFSLQNIPLRGCSAPFVGCTFRVFYHFQLKGSIVIISLGHPQQHLPSLRRKTAGYSALRKQCALAR